MGKTWFCQECRVIMQHKAGGFEKCPVCGAEAWPFGEGTYRQDERGAELGVKLHGVWYCQRCRVPMVPVDEHYCKCPSCAAEIWYGDSGKRREDMRAMMETTEDNPVYENARGGTAVALSGRPARGGAHSRKRHRQDLAKPTTEELYRRLCSE